MILKFKTQIPIDQIGATPNLLDFFSNSVVQSPEVSFVPSVEYGSSPSSFEDDSTLIEKIKEHKKDRRSRARG